MQRGILRGHAASDPVGRLAGAGDHRICKLLRMSEAHRSRFMAGAGLSMAYLDALAELQQLSVTTKQPKTRREA